MRLNPANNPRMPPNDAENINIYYFDVNFHIAFNLPNKLRQL